MLRNTQILAGELAELLHALGGCRSLQDCSALMLAAAA